jgi:hypothetical protein
MSLADHYRIQRIGLLRMDHRIEELTLAENAYRPGAVLPVNDFNLALL